jgi:hypothetical protein
MTTEIDQTDPRPGQSNGASGPNNKGRPQPCQSVGGGVKLGPNPKLGGSSNGQK